MESLEKAECNQRIFSLAVAIGEAMLSSGGEVYRVEDTIIRVLKAYGIGEYNVFVLSHGIMANMDESKPDRTSVIRNVPLGRINLEKISALDRLARDIHKRSYTVEEAWKQFEACKAIPAASLLVRILGSVLACAASCYFVGGRPLEIAIVGMLGMLLQTCKWLGERLKVSGYVSSVMGSALVTGIALILLFQMGLPIRLFQVVTGTIVVLVPGVSIAYGMRELFMENYLSGMIRLTDALVTGICISIGVAGAMLVYGFFTGNYNFMDLSKQGIGIAMSIHNDVTGGELV